jgi:hypothetical protein
VRVEDNQAMVSPLLQRDGDPANSLQIMNEIVVLPLFCLLNVIVTDICYGFHTEFLPNHVIL